MENNTTLERLNGQINALIAAVQEARDENARLADELNACQAITRQREDTVNELEESVGLKDLELEDLAARIEGVLGAPAAAADSAAPATESSSESNTTAEPAMA